jgi:hypothetical protein
VRAEEGDVERFRPILEQQPQSESPAALEELAAQLADSEPCVAMRLAEGFGQLAQREQALAAILFRQLSKPAEYLRVDAKKLSCPLKKACTLRDGATRLLRVSGKMPVGQGKPARAEERQSRVSKHEWVFQRAVSQASS